MRRKAPLRPSSLATGASVVHGLDSHYTDPAECQSHSAVLELRAPQAPKAHREELSALPPYQQPDLAQKPGIDQAHVAIVIVSIDKAPERVTVLGEKLDRGFVLVLKNGGHGHQFAASCPSLRCTQQETAYALTPHRRIHR